MPRAELPALPPNSRGWVYIGIQKDGVMRPPQMMTVEEWALEERWKQVRIVDEGGWILRSSER